MTTGGEFLATKIKQVIDADSDVRIVYSAGGGENAAAEAIGYLRSKSLHLSEPDAATPDSCSARSGSVCLSKKLPISRTAIFPSGRK